MIFLTLRRRTKSANELRRNYRERRHWKLLRREWFLKLQSKPARIMSRASVELSYGLR